jgi:hypothetical protein
MKNNRSIIIAILLALVWLPWVLDRLTARPDDIVCDGGGQA